MARIDNRTTDATLLAAYRAGDLRAWDLLVERYQALVCAIPRRMGLSTTDVEDVAQNVFIALLNNIDRIRDETRLAAWLVTTARHESWAFSHRNRTRSATLPDPETLETIPETELDALPEAAALALEEQHLVRTALQTLPERCRTLLTWLYATDPPKPYAEIADSLNIPIGSIGPTRARCLERLHNKIKEQGF